MYADEQRTPDVIIPIHGTIERGVCTEIQCQSENTILHTVEDLRRRLSNDGSYDLGFYDGVSESDLERLLTGNDRYSALFSF